MPDRDEVRAAKLTGAPSFLTLGAWRDGALSFEIAGRARLDARLWLPWYRSGGAIHVGLWERERASRSLRGAPLLGLETPGHDFSGVDETADIREVGAARFAGGAGLTIDPAGLQIPLPSFARSIGYLSELCLPLLVPVLPPELNLLELGGGVPGRLRFLPLDEALSTIDGEGGPPFAEELKLLLRALRSPLPQTREPVRDLALAQAAWFWSERDAQERRARERAGDRLLERFPGRVLGAAELDAAPALHGAFVRARDPLPEELRFLSLSRLELRGAASEVVTPASNVALTLLPLVRSSRGTYFLLWREVRPAALERQARAPLFDLPVPATYVNATGFFLAPEDAAAVSAGETGRLPMLAPALLSRALGQEVAVRGLRLLGRPAEPAPGVSSGELRACAAVELDPGSLRTLPPEAFLIEAGELATAVAEGRVRDPVVVLGLLSLAPELSRPGAPIDPFAAARSGEPRTRAAFLTALTRGSEVQRRLQGYSSIEAEQLQAPTYARLMTLLQHEYGLRIAYPKTEKDRGFFKAAFRVFMAADRGEDDRALQGLHWSHDAYHFALGNFLVPPPPDFQEWFVSGADAPAEQPPEGPAWERYSSALKAAENEATFFSFWTLYDEHLPLARHVGKLTFWEALRDLGVTERKAARAIYDDVVDRAALPALVKEHPVYQARADVRSLFDYMLGFRAYHFKDIAIAWRFATKDPYRGYLARFGIYQGELDAYLLHVRTFFDRLWQLQRGLNPLLCALAEVRLDLQLRVWDVTKALRLLRAATLARGLPPEEGRAARAALLAGAEPFLHELEEVQSELAALRAQVRDAEATPRNQELWTRAGALAGQVEDARSRLWDWAGGAGLLDPAQLAGERVRELPR